MTQPIKLLLLVPHLGGGGAERVTAHLSRRLDRARFNIQLALISEDGPGAEPPPEWITVHRFHLKRVRYSLLRLLRLIRTQRPDVVLSSMAHLNFLLLMLKPLLPRNTRILVRQNTTASAVARTRVSRLFYSRLYPLADAIICQSNAMADDLTQHFGIASMRLEVLANPIELSIFQATDAAQNPSPKWTANSHPRLLSVGRLSPEKGMDLLIRSLVSVRQQYPQLQLTILGIGSEQTALQQLIHDLDLDQAITIAGHANPATYYHDATLYVLPSRIEGMPNALLEAAVAGLPLVATPCSRGVSDLLLNAPGTWLAPTMSSEALSETILAALSELHSSSGTLKRFRHPFLEPFAINTAIKAYENLLTHVALQGKP